MPNNKRFSASSGGSAASKFGQMIGLAFEKVAYDAIRSYLSEYHPGYEIVEPDEGTSIITLDMFGGLARQMDTVLRPKASDDPIALLESKWLKDARHHNDKGAWILQLREVKKKYPTIRGAAAILLGFWSEGMGMMLLNEGGIRMVWIANDEQVYSTLQPHLDSYLQQDSFQLDAKEMRKSYPRPWDLANMLLDLDEQGLLDSVAKSWLQLERVPGTTGIELIHEAIDELLNPIPEAPQLTTFEVSFGVETGNVIHGSFKDMEEFKEFVEKYLNNPEEVRKRITPKSKSDDKET